MISDFVIYPLPSKVNAARYITPSSLLLIFTRPLTNTNYPFSSRRIDIDYYISFTPLHFLPALQLTKQTQLRIMQSYQYVNRTHAHIYLSSTGDLPRLFNYSKSPLSSTFLLCLPFNRTFFFGKYN